MCVCVCVCVCVFFSLFSRIDLCVYVCVCLISAYQYNTQTPQHQQHQHQSFPQPHFNDDAFQFQNTNNNNNRTNTTNNETKSAWDMSSDEFVASFAQLTSNLDTHPQSQGTYPWRNKNRAANTALFIKQEPTTPIPTLNDILSMTHTPQQQHTRTVVKSEQKTKLTPLPYPRRQTPKRTTKKQQTNNSNSNNSSTNMPSRRVALRRTTSVLLKSVLKRVNDKYKIDVGKQNCHFCGRNRPLDQRHVCHNPYCALQGLKRKYICKLCMDYQRTYFTKLGVEFKNVYGNPNDPNWYCPACVLWEDNIIPHPGICCCSFRRNNLLCPMHVHSAADLGLISPSGTKKTNFHCKPYKQKTSLNKRMDLLPVDIRRIRMGSQQHMRRLSH